MWWLSQLQCGSKWKGILPESAFHKVCAIEGNDAKGLRLAFLEVEKIDWKRKWVHIRMDQRHATQVNEPMC